MPLASGVRVGPFDVTARIGAGGMGEVWRARDTNLGRDVAIKVLPDAFARDPERLARFEREARTLASLNHPNIAAIYGLEKTEPPAGSGPIGTRALVMELVEGPTLADRIAGGAMPLTDVLPVARQIAEALEAAHEQGIVHRDLKPANIKVRDDGTVKVLDFGLAKALARDGPSASDGLDVSDSPTITSPATTDRGVVLGTAAYMSPEQARGRPLDKRTDIWAFGCVLYEMLTGRRAFPGDNVSDTLAAVLRGEPAWSALPADLPRSIRALLHRSLAKERAHRIGDASTARFVLNEYVDLAAEPAARRRGWSSAVRFGVLTLAAGVGIGAGTVFLATRPEPPRVTRLTIEPPVVAPLSINGLDRSLAISPDGSRVVYVGANAGAIYVRSLGDLDAVPITGLGQPRGPFISPDGQWIGYFDSSTVMKRVAITGGPSVVLTRLDGGSRGAAWLPNGTIIFATNASTGLQRIAVDGAGSGPTVLTRPDRSRGEADHLWPEVLPGGRVVLFTITSATGGLDAASIAALDLQSGEQTIILRGGFHAQYVPGGHLIYGAGSALRAVAFDPASLQTLGTPVEVVGSLMTAQLGAVEAAVAADGTLVYVPGTTQVTARTLVWVDRQGKETPISAAPPKAYSYPRVSPDGRHVAVVVLDQGYDVWLWDVSRQHMTPATFDPGVDTFPVWFPDNRRMAFSSDRTGARNVFSLLADGTGAVEQLTQGPNRKNAGAITPDGKQVLFVEVGAAGSDIMAIHLDDPGKVRPVANTAVDERNPAVSPEGWLAYEADDAGQVEIFVRPFPNVGSGFWKVSTQTRGGTRPVWSRNSPELFYLAPGGELMSVRFERGPTWSAAAPVKVLDARYFTGAGALVGVTYDVSPDGRFLMIRASGESSSSATSPRLVVVQHFDEDLKRLAVN